MGFYVYSVAEDNLPASLPFPNKYFFNVRYRRMYRYQIILHLYIIFFKLLNPKTLKMENPALDIKNLVNPK